MYFTGLLLTGYGWGIIVECFRRASAHVACAQHGHSSRVLLHYWQRLFDLYCDA